MNKRWLGQRWLRFFMHTLTVIFKLHPRHYLPSVGIADRVDVPERRFEFLAYQTDFVNDGWKRFDHVANGFHVETAPAYGFRDAMRAQDVGASHDHEIATPEGFTRLMRREYLLYQTLIREEGIKPE